MKYLSQHVYMCSKISESQQTSKRTNKLINAKVHIECKSLSHILDKSSMVTNH